MQSSLKSDSPGVLVDDFSDMMFAGDMHCIAFRTHTVVLLNRASKSVINVSRI